MDIRVWGGFLAAHSQQVFRIRNPLGLSYPLVEPKDFSTSLEFSKKA